MLQKDRRWEGANRMERDQELKATGRSGSGAENKFH